MDWRTNFRLVKPLQPEKIELRPEVVGILAPENEIERKMLAKPEFRKGLLWGQPRFGHPEGEIWKHIREVLDNIDLLHLSFQDRARLRQIAFVHDTFKYREDKSYPRDWTRHHAVYARHFIEQFTEDPAVLLITELHDEAFYCWRTRHIFNQPAEGEERLSRLLRQIRPFLQLYYSFFWCDTRTGDKNQTPLIWFEDCVPEIRKIPRSV